MQNTEIQSARGSYKMERVTLRAASGSVVPKKFFELIAAKDKHLVWLGDRVQFQFYEDPETIDLAVSNVSEWFNRHV